MLKKQIKFTFDAATATLDGGGMGKFRISFDDNKWQSNRFRANNFYAENDPGDLKWEKNTCYAIPESPTLKPCLPKVLPTSQIWGKDRCQL